MYTKAIKPPAFIFIRPFESLRDRMNYSYLFSFANFFIKSTRAFTPSRVIAL